MVHEEDLIAGGICQQRAPTSRLVPGGDVSVPHNRLVVPGASAGDSLTHAGGGKGELALVENAVAAARVVPDHRAGDLTHAGLRISKPHLALGGDGEAEAFLV